MAFSFCVVFNNPPVEDADCNWFRCQRVIVYCVSIVWAPSSGYGDLDRPWILAPFHGVRVDIPSFYFPLVVYMVQFYLKVGHRSIRDMSAVTNSSPYHPAPPFFRYCWLIISMWALISSCRCTSRVVRGGYLGHFLSISNLLSNSNIVVLSLQYCKKKTLCEPHVNRVRMLTSNYLLPGHQSISSSWTDNSMGFPWHLLLLLLKKSVAVLFLVSYSPGPIPYTTATEILPLLNFVKFLQFIFTVPSYTFICIYFPRALRCLLSLIKYL